MKRVCLLFLGLLFILIGEITHAMTCPPGHKIVGPRKKCMDIDECTDTPGLCGKRAVCNNTAGSYFCTCEDGFTTSRKEMEKFKAYDAVICTDFNECLNETDLCGTNAECKNTVGSYFCTCKEGFTPSNGEGTFKAGMGVTCEDRDECEMVNCGKNAVCKNTMGSYHCTCEPGYKHTSGKSNFTEGEGVCEDIDECTDTPWLCGNNAVCNNTAGSYFCTCEYGFTTSRKEIEKFKGDNGVMCRDINECLNETDLCGANAECNNTVGSYFCTCKEGFSPSNGEETFKAGMGVTCEDQDECEMAECGKNAVCKNTPGSYYCTCEPGYKHTSGKSNFSQGEGACEVNSQECVCTPEHIAEYCRRVKGAEL